MTEELSFGEKETSPDPLLPFRERGKISPVLEAFQAHHSALRRYISRFVRRSHDIDDVAQEAFLRAYRTELQRDIEQPKSFLFKIAHNVAVTELTRKSSQIVDYIEDIDTMGAAGRGNPVEEALSAKQKIGIHCEAVAQLPVQCRRVYLMRKVHGMSHKEISQRLDIAISTVEKHLAKGIRRCARYVQEREDAGREIRLVDVAPNNNMEERHRG